MSPLTTITFTRGNKRYDIRVDFDDQAIMDDMLVLAVTARVTDSSYEERELPVTIEVDLANRRASVIHEGETLHSFSFSDLGVRIDGDGVESPPGMESGEEGQDALAEFVDANMGERIQQLIDEMPNFAFDPVLFCALKAGISSTLGQTLACNEIVGSEFSKRQRIWRVVRCLRTHVGGILTRTLWRAGRCIARFGLV